MTDPSLSVQHIKKISLQYPIILRVHVIIIIQHYFIIIKMVLDYNHNMY